MKYGIFIFFEVTFVLKFYLELFFWYEKEFLRKRTDVIRNLLWKWKKKFKERGLSLTCSFWQISIVSSNLKLIAKPNQQSNTLTRFLRKSIPLWVWKYSIKFQSPLWGLIDAAGVCTKKSTQKKLMLHKEREFSFQTEIESYIECCRVQYGTK